MKTQLIQLERYDDVTSVADKITSSRANRILLVWPRRKHILGRYLDLVLIQRTCREIGAQLACLVDDEVILDHAQELGIPVFRSAKTAQRLLWLRARHKRVFEPQVRLPLSAIEMKRMAARPKTARWKSWLWLRLSLFTIGVAAIMLAALLLLPEARVGLVLAQEQQVIELPVYASPALKELNLSGGLPAQYLSVVLEGQDEQLATGMVQIGEKAASGQVVFTNLTDQVVVIAMGTRVLTSGVPAVFFETLREVSLPARPGSSVETTVQALQPGNQGNVAAGAIQAISGEVGSRLRVTNPGATTGGRDLVTTAVSAEDVLLVRQRLSATLLQKAAQEVQSRRMPGQRLFPETLRMVKVLREQQSPSSGTAAERVSLTLQLEFSVWTIQAADLETLARLVLDANLPDGTMGLESGLQINDSQAPELEQGQIKWQIRATRMVQARWTDHAVIRAVTWRSVEAARQALAAQIRLVQPPVIELIPAWWPLFPVLPGRITVIVQ